MEHKLLQVFDRQRFQQNERLAGIIGEVESRYAHVLSDDVWRWSVRLATTPFRR